MKAAYLYRCPQCRTEVEVYQERAGEHVHTQTCQVCGYEGPYKRKFSLPQVVYRGQGWPRKDAWLDKETQMAVDAADRMYQRPLEHPIGEDEAFWQDLANEGFDAHKPTIYGDPGLQSAPLKAEAVAASLASGDRLSSAEVAAVTAA